MLFSPRRTILRMGQTMSVTDRYFKACSSDRGETVEYVILKLSLNLFSCFMDILVCKSSNFMTSQAGKIFSMTAALPK